MSEKKDIRDYLHLYLGCKVEYDGRIGIVHQYYLPAGKYMEGKVWVCSLEEDGNPEMSCSAEANLVKPLLRRLSDMTEVEKKEYKDLFLEHPDCYQKTRWLLSKHFDLYDLIDSGLAIETKTT